MSGADVAGFGKLSGLPRVIGIGGPQNVFEGRKIFEDALPSDLSHCITRHTIPIIKLLQVIS